MARFIYYETLHEQRKNKSYVRVVYFDTDWSSKCKYVKKALFLLNEFESNQGSSKVQVSENRAFQ